MSDNYTKMKDLQQKRNEKYDDLIEKAQNIKHIVK